MFELKNISIQDGDSLILDIPALTINEGEKVVVSGESGAGKTTLLKLFNRFLTPSSGTIAYLNKDLELQSTAMIRADIKMVTQNIFLPDKNVIDVFSEVFMLKANNDISNSEESIRGILDELGLNYIELSSSTINLSGGEKQRIAIARTILLNPRVLLLDEPTSALDKASSKSLLDCLNSRNITAITVTHDEDWKSAAQKTINLRKGKIVGGVDG
jgi:putative ABC transport system ATP-binding protein